MVILKVSLVIASNTNNYSSFVNTSELTYGRNIYEYEHRVKWLCFNASEEYDCCQIKEVHCFENGPALPYGYCATYSESNLTESLSIAKCPYLQSNIYNMTTPENLPLPVSLTELNDYMCGPLNRKGLVCSECADGFGPSVTSYGYKCANCTNTWYHVVLFLFTQFVPTTVFYGIILVFQIRVISPPLPCFIMFAQLFIVGFDTYPLYQLITHGSYNGSYELIFTKDGDVRLDMKIIRTFYGFFNQMDIFLYLLPPTCLSTRLKQIHVVFLGYISVFYPIFLIFLTWVCVSLHDNNCRPLVWLWRPFHKCFVRLRKGWDIKSDLVDVFITFLFLSYTKSSYLAAVLILRNNGIMTVDHSGNVTYMRNRLAIDQTINFYDHAHIPFVVIALLILFMFNILPPLLLTLYPFRIFRSCLSKCRLDFIAINNFADKMQHFYRNGLDGGRDMRSFSGLHFFSMYGIYLIAVYINKGILDNSSIFLSNGITGLTIALVIYIAKPYQKMYMNNVDGLIFTCFALHNFASASRAFLISRIFHFIPIVGFLLVIMVKMIKRYLVKFKAPFQKCCNNTICRFRNFLRSTQRPHTDNSDAHSPTATQPLIYQVSSEINYGSYNV